MPSSGIARFCGACGACGARGTRGTKGTSVLAHFRETHIVRRSTSWIPPSSLFTVPKAVLDGKPMGRLRMGQTVRLDAALRFSLDVRY